MMSARPCSLDVAIEHLPLNAPFRISGHVFTETRVVIATLRDGKAFGRGEAAGVYYLGEDPGTMARQIEACRNEIEKGISREELRGLMPPGGARNSVDCALWELEAQRANSTVRELASVASAHPLLTAFTLGADAPEQMLERAASFPGPRALKLKLTGEDIAMDIERVRRVRAAFPEQWIGIDGNQGFTVESFAELLPALVEARVELVEQPLPRGRERDMERIERFIPMAADESALDLRELEALVGRFDIVNIKLDKCGGLTEGLMMARRARELGLGVMVGNMTGSSWAMAPAFVLGQLCDIVDLDGVTFLARDRAPGISYVDGHVHCPDRVWGSAEARMGAEACAA